MNNHDMPGNDYVPGAMLRLDGVHDWQAEEGSTDATNLAAIIDAQTQATLALAYEQRTANLIAFERAQWDAWRQDELNPEGVELWRRAAEQVNERLGLA